MTTRREFLQAGIAASAATPIAAGVFASDNPTMSELSASALSLPPMPFYKVVFDERFPDSVAFAAEMKRLGVAVHGIRGDMTDFWYHELYPQWRKSPVPIAGLTGHGPLFCLERLAWDHGMRVMFRAEHQYRPDGCVEHVMSAHEAVLRDAFGLATAGSNWSAQLAGLVSRCGQGRLETSPAIVTRLGEPPRMDQETLFSWVIGPVVRV
jgi:hypothetical protein